MNSLKRITLALGALLVLGVPILAQAPPAAPGQTPAKGAGNGGGQGRRAGASTLPISVLNMMVTLKDEQKTKVTAIQDKLKTDVEAAAGDRMKIRELNTAANDDIKAVLTPEQQKLMAEKLPIVMLLNQSKAIRSGVLADVKLTSEQMDKIKTAAAATQEKMKAVAQADRRTKNPEILADFKTEVEGFLTAEQKETISKYHAPKAAPKKPTV